MFKYKGIKINYKDFGNKCDMCPECAEPYGCGDMQFISNEIISKEILEKYNITIEEARQIQKKLEEVLSFGCCGWCT